MIELGLLLERLEVAASRGRIDPGLKIGKISSDSRQVTEGTLFIAVRGYVTDGHRYIGDAVANGAVAVVCETLPDSAGENGAYIVVPDSRKAMAHIAKAFYGDPSDKLQVIGVTGTNGKTTTARLIAAMLNSCGIRAGYIGTGLALAGDEAIPLERTTPEAEELHRLFLLMAERGCRAVVMEVSSHALVLQRTSGIAFAGAVFTNLSQDHLDFHHTMEKYAVAKKQLFGNLAAGGFMVVNADDPYGKFMAENLKDATLYCCTMRSGKPDCPGDAFEEVRSTVLESSMKGTQVKLEIEGEVLEVFFGIPGRHNVMNLMEAFVSVVAMGITPQRVIMSLCSMPQVEGRMEVISNDGGDLFAVVDYAHTPDALDKVIDTLNALKTEGARLVVVFGCGGNRDRTKRPVMGEIVSGGADCVVVTSDNPRDEDPETIIDHIAEGISSQNYMRFVDRAEAVRSGVNLLKKGDILLVAGKGHEKYQELKGKRRYFCDQETVREALYARETSV